MSTSSSKKNKLRKNSPSQHLICKLFWFFTILLCISSCATYKEQYGKNAKNYITEKNSSDSIQYQLFLIGNTAGKNQNQPTLNAFEKQLQKASENSTAVFLGNKFDSTIQKYEPENEYQSLEKLLDLTKDFKGNTLFINGSFEWQKGIDDIIQKNNFIKKQSSNPNTFYLPQNGCGIGQFEINENISIIAIDSQWILEDWNKHPEINENCFIKSHEDFYDEFESLLSEQQNKITFVVLYHPLISNGIHGGQFSFKKQIYPFNQKIPLPFLGTIINQIRKTSGISQQDIHNYQYQNFVKRLETTLKDQTNVIFLSANEQNLQYLEKKYIKQIISGASSKTEAARAVNENDFSYGGNGFVVINVYNNGQTIANYFGVEKDKEKLLFSKEIVESLYKLNDNPDQLYQNFPPTFTSQVYPDYLNNKTNFYKFWFGDHYRDYYTLPIEAQTLNLSTYLGGLNPVKVSGEEQSRTLRLVDRQGKEYVLRALSKSATHFVQNIAFKNQFIEPDLKNTFTERFILDFYTTTNPFYPFVIHELAEPIGLYHTNPKLFYLPKQPRLGIYNHDFGNELYLFEEKPMHKFSDLDSFGKPQNIVSTNKMVENVISDDNYQVDYKIYIRARLFDMLIGDWNRDADQWSWAEFMEDDQHIYRPIIKDRDQVFPKYDGAFVSFIMRIPALKHMQNFGEEIKNLKWFNMEPYALDLFATSRATLQNWISEAELIKTKLTPEVIDNSFQNIPQEVDDKNVVKIKNLLKTRIQKLTDYATEYFEILQKTVVIPGTQQKDKFIITRLGNGHTKVEIYNDDELYFDHVYQNQFTDEIWLYGLNDEDHFIVKGKHKKPIKLRLIGGLDDDLYQVELGKKVFIYDFKSNPIDKKLVNQAHIHLSNDYETNTYSYDKPKFNKLQILPNGWYNPDDEVGVGLNLIYTVNNFVRNPFTEKHQLLSNVFFLTQSFSLDYNGTFAKVLGNWNLEIGAGGTNASFSTNFFGLGNDTENLAYKNRKHMDYYRVRSQTLYLTPALSYRFRNQAKLTFHSRFEKIKVYQSENRITFSHPDINPEVYNNQYFGELGLNYIYKNYDYLAQPKLGFLFELGAFWKTNLNHHNQHLPILSGTIGFTQKVTKSDAITFSSRIKSKVLLSNDFQFYQAATLGGDEDLRAYPRGRFSGKSSFLSSSDFRIKFGKLKGFVPMTFGGLIGYDIGRVWIAGENSQKWHQSLGGSMWINGANVLSFKMGYFHGDDGGRITIGVNFGF